MYPSETIAPWFFRGKWVENLQDDRFLHPNERKRSYWRFSTHFPRKNHGYGFGRVLNITFQKKGHSFQQGGYNWGYNPI